MFVNINVLPIFISGSWQFDPYISFALSALVEMFAYIFIHVILDRLGRKLPYCAFAIAFGLLALLVLPVQFVLAERKTSEIFLYELNNPFTYVPI